MRNLTESKTGHFKHFILNVGALSYLFYFTTVSMNPFLPTCVNIDIFMQTFGCQPLIDNMNNVGFVENTFVIDKNNHY